MTSDQDVTIAPLRGRDSMMKRRGMLGIAIVVSGAVLCGCQADAGDTDAGSAKPDAAMPAAPDETVHCEGKPTLTTGVTSGSKALGAEGLINARLVDANPLPPTISTPSMPNPADWTVEFTDAKGEPVTDVELSAVCAYMPAHGHSGPPKKITAMDEPGRFKLDGLRFTMAGDWEVQFALTSPSISDSTAEAPNCKASGRPAAAGNELVIFRVCIPDL